MLRGHPAPSSQGHAHCLSSIGRHVHAPGLPRGPGSPAACEPVPAHVPPAGFLPSDEPLCASVLVLVPEFRRGGLPPDVGGPPLQPPSLPVVWLPVRPSDASPPPSTVVALVVASSIPSSNSHPPGLVILRSSLPSAVVPTSGVSHLWCFPDCSSGWSHQHGRKHDRRAPELRPGRLLVRLLSAGLGAAPSAPRCLRRSIAL